MVRFLFVAADVGSESLIEINVQPTLKERRERGRTPVSKILFQEDEDTVVHSPTAPREFRKPEKERRTEAVNFRFEGRMRVWFVNWWAI